MLGAHWVRKILWTAAALLLLSLLAPLVVQVNYWKASITAALSEGLGRPVRAGQVRLMLLGGPGFEVENVVVGEDPRFGIEPFARMETLRATLRLESLWQDRMRFSTLVFVRPSLNVVRGADGHWNLESLGKARAPRRRSPQAAGERAGPASGESPPHADFFPLLPQIQVQSGRINFKARNQKKVYVLDALDMELLAPPSAGKPWKLRFEGTPNRTDFPLRPVSRIQGKGEFGPFSSPLQAETGVPLRLELRAENALPADLLKVFTGHDYGLHGTLHLRCRLAGTTSLLRLSATADLQDLHRWDLLPPPTSVLRAEIAGILDVDAESLQLTSVSIPLAEGSVLLQGEIGKLFHRPSPDLRAELRGVSLAAVVQFARQFTTRLNSNLLAQGILDGRLQMAGSVDTLMGHLSLTGGLLEENKTGQKVSLSDFRAVFEGTTGRVGPLKASLEKGGEVAAEGQWDLEKRETTFHLSGKRVSLASFLPWARTLGSRWGEANFAEGNLALEVDVTATAGKPPQIGGWAQVSDAVLHSAAVNHPIQVLQARLQFQPGEVKVQPFSAALGEMELQGSLRAKLSSPSSPLEFDVQASGIDIADLDRLLNPRYRPATYFLFGKGKESNSPFFSRLAARGTLHAQWVRYRGAAIGNFSASLDFHDRLLEIHNFAGEFAGGSQTGEATIRFATNVPSFEVESHYSGLDLQQLTSASASWDGFFSGRISGYLQLAGSGANRSEILDHLVGSGDVAGHNLALQGLDLTGRPADISPNPVTRIASLSGRFRIEEREVLITELRMVPRRAREEEENALGPPPRAVTGTIGFDRTLDLVVREEAGGQQHHWAGTLAEPHLTDTAALFAPARN